MPEFNDAAEPDKKIEKKSSTKMKSTSTKGDNIDKGRTMTGSKPDTININPELSRMEAKNVSLINSIYDQVTEKLDRNNTHNREPGTDSLTNIYKNDTPGQVVDAKFKLQFKDPKGDKEAVSRSGNPKRKEMDLVPRMDPERDRKKDSSFFRQQSIVKKVLEAKNPFKKSAWERMLDNNPKHKKSEENAQKAKEALKQNAKDYEDIVNKDKKNMNEITHTLIHRYIDNMISKHPEAMSPLKAKTKKDKMRASALQLALDKDYPKSAIHKPHIIATEEVINEISPELAGKVNGRHEIDGVPYRSSAAYNAVKNAVRKAAGVKKPGPYVLPDVDKVPPGIGMKEDTTSEKDPLQHLEDRLNKAGDTSHNAIDKIMRDVADDFDMKVQDLHNKWVSKYKITPDQYVKEDYETPVTTGKLASPDHYSAIKDIALNTKNRNLIKEGKNSSPPWGKSNPNKKHHHLTPAQKANAKRRAKAAGRPWPNWVDNVAAAHEETLHEGVVYHLENEIPFCESIFRYGSKKFFETIEEARKLFNEGTINLTGSDLELIRTDIGSFGLYEGKEVPIDLPLTEEEKPDHPPLGKPHKGGPKKYYVYVKKPDGGIKKVTFGDSHGAADGSTLPSRINDPVARKSFAARHKCHLQTDRTSAAYWSCNLPRYAKALGLSGGGSFYW